jgi:outer membrane receptor for ferrienterochelin and colicins
MFKTVTIIWFCSIFTIALSGQAAIDTMIDQVLDQVVVTAQFSPTDLREAVNTVKVITRQTIELRAATNLGELLQSESNMRISNDAVLGVALSLNGIRGENVKILLDGAPIAGRIQGNLDLNQIPLTDILRIEIVEGAQSLIYGSDASGGVINLITRQSQLSTFNGNLNGMYEQNGFKNTTAQMGYRRDRLFINLTGNLQNFDPAPDSVGRRDQYWNPKDQKSARANIRYNINPKSEIRISGGFLNEKITDLGEIRRPQFKPYAFDDIYKISRNDGNLFYQYIQPKKWISQLVLRASSYDRIDNAYRYEILTDSSSLIPMLQDTNLSSAWSARWTWASDKQTAKLNYLFGAEHNTENAQGSRLMDVLRSNRSSVSYYESGIFATAKYQPSKTWTMQGGVRWVIHQNYGQALLPSLWTVYKPQSKPYTIKFSSALGYRSPSIEELYFRFVDINHFVVGNVNLKPEKSINLKGEYTYTKNLGNNLVETRLSGFYNHISNRIILAATGPIEFEYSNLEIWKSVGANLSVKVDLGTRTQYKASMQRAGYYNALAVENKDVPTFGWSTDWTNEVTYHLITDDKLSINLWHKMTGQTPYYFYNKEGLLSQDVLSSWHFLNGAVSTRLLNKKWLVQVGAKNITNIKERKSNFNSANHTDLANQQSLHWGRTWFVSTSISF